LTLSSPESSETTYSGSISGGSGAMIYKEGAGTQEFTGSFADFGEFDGGVIQVEAGLLNMSPTTGTDYISLTVEGSPEIDFGATQTLAGLDLGDYGTPTMSVLSGETTFSGPILGGVNASIAKEGGGTLTLAGSFAFSGQITANDGLLDPEQA